MPGKLDASDGTIINIYDVTGAKYKQISTNTETGVNETTVYFGASAYINNKLDAIYHAEGRYVFEENQQAHEYFLKDHLGNTRARFSDKNNDHKLDTDLTITDTNEGKVIETNEFYGGKTYYPFGLAFTHEVIYDDNDKLIWYDKTNAKGNAYNYNGKEDINSINTGLGDYGFRLYDATVARFNSVDPLASTHSKQSTFVYAANNPIKYIDFLGLGPKYNWENGRYEDDNGNEVSWNHVQEYYGIGNAKQNENQNEQQGGRRHKETLAKEDITELFGIRIQTNVKATLDKYIKDHGINGETKVLEIIVPLTTDTPANYTPRSRDRIDEYYNNMRNLYLSDENYLKSITINAIFDNRIKKQDRKVKVFTNPNDRTKQLKMLKNYINDEYKMNIQIKISDGKDWQLQTINFEKA